MYTYLSIYINIYKFVLYWCIYDTDSNTRLHQDTPFKSIGGGSFTHTLNFCTRVIFGLCRKIFNLESTNMYMYLSSYSHVYLSSYSHMYMYLSSYPMLMYTYICKRIYLRIFHRILMFHRVFRFIFVVGFCCKMLINNTYGVSCR